MAALQICWEEVLVSNYILVFPKLRNGNLFLTFPVRYFTDDII